MMYKPCAPPKDGGSAKGVCRYILGYELGAKREEWEIRNASYHALIAESLQRADLGVGTHWTPAVGGGVRPSSVLVLNVASLATADVEMQALHQSNKRTKTPTHHEIWAFGNDPGLTDERALDAVHRAYERVGLGAAAMVMAVHRDTDDLHVHVARSGINPATLRAYDHQQINTRMDHASRAIEMEMGLFHDRGLAVVDHAADGQAFIRDSTVPERIAWRRDQREERLIALERARYVDNALREGSFARYAEARIEPRFREVIERATDAGERVHAIDVANTAARLGAVLQLDDAGHLQIRDVSTARLREQQRDEVAQIKAATADAKSLLREEQLEALRLKHKGELAAEMRRLLTEGDVAPLTPMMEKELRAALRDPRMLGDEIRTERAFVEAVDRDPGLVSRALTQTSSTFGRDDVDRYLVDRIADVGEIERLARRIFAEDKNLVLLSPDVADGVWTTREMLEIEQQVADHARTLAQRPDPTFSVSRRDAAIAAMEAERSTPSEPFLLSDEQREALSKSGGLVVILGRSGAGKTTAMEALRRDAEAAGRPIRGVTIAQAAAIRLEVEAGFGCVNTAFALLADGPRRELIPRNGTLIIDEAGMVDSRTMRALLRLASDRDTSVVAIGDPRQIQAVGAGGAWRILEAAARDAGTFAELTENRRQQHDWHRDAVALTSHAIEHENMTAFARAAQLLEQHAALHFVPTKDDAIADAVTWYERERSKSDDALLVATDRDTVRYLNEDLLRRRPDRGPERRYLTDGGTRGLAVGDRFIFGANSNKIGVVNGDTGSVVATGQNVIDVRLDRTHETVSFDARSYLEWDHGYASTIARAQGASVRAIGGIVDGAATAEAFHVLIGRSKDQLHMLVPQTAFEDATELAEHLRDRIIAKGTTQDISAEVAQRGGPDSFYARNVNAQQVSAQNPDRQEWEREWTAMRNRRDVAIRTLAAEYRPRIAAASAEQKKRLRQEQRKAEAAIVRDHRPEDFGVWLHRREEREEATLQRLEALYKQRDAVTAQRSIKPKKAIDYARKVKTPTSTERELKERVDAELRRAAGIQAPEPKKSHGPRR